MRPPQCRCALHPPAVVLCCTFFFFNDTATTEIYTLSLHDALPILERVAEPFLERFTSEMRARKVGDPLDPATHVGPQARLDLREKLHRQVQEAVKRGARLVLGGELPAGRGAFYAPTVLVAVEPGMPVFEQETVG